MNYLEWILWGGIATLTLTALMMAAQHFRLSRINLPLLLGTLLLSNRDRAQVVGVGIHLLNGWILSFAYAAIFHSLRMATWYLGVGLGVLHGLIFLAVFLPLLPGIHPRMASEHQSPTQIRLLEPPGFLGLNYGPHTPLTSLIGHAIYGLILGSFYGFALR